MKNEFAPYKLALRMKQLGYDEPCFGFYKLGNIDIYYDTILQGQNHKFRNNTQLNFYGDLKEKISAPTFSQAFRWCREKYNIFPELLTDCTTRPKFCYTYTKFFGNQNDLASEEWGWESNVGQYSLLYKTYEEAQIACLEKLIEIAEQI